MRAASPCPQPGCPNLRPCAEHETKPWQGSDRSRRLPGNWDTLRAIVLERDHRTCQACYGLRCGNRNLEVDHIIPGDDHRTGNLQTLGHDCHTEKTTAEAAAARGAPPPS